MSTIQQLINDIDLRYPNSLSNTQKIYWLNRVQKEIFQEAKHEAPLYYFTTVSGQSFYPLPSDCDPDDIIKFTIEAKSGSNDYRPLTFREFDSDEYVASTDEFCTIFNGNIYLNPQPTTSTAGRKVYLYYNKHPAELSETNLSVSPDLQEAYQDLLVFGVIRRIAQAWNDIVTANNYTAEYNALMRQLKLKKLHKMPKYPVTKDVMKKRHNLGRIRETIEVVIT